MRFLLVIIGIFFMNVTHAAEFQISSTVFKEGDTIPAKYTCSGNDVSPPLTWSGAPNKTQSFALICDDPDAPAGTWYHWIVYNIPVNMNEIKENQTPSGSIVGKNSWGHARYNGPCPPPGKPHHYNFTLYALDSKLDLTSADADTLQKNMKGHIIETAKITAIFGR